jgi:hypothetical protein
MWTAEKEKLKPQERQWQFNTKQANANNTAVNLNTKRAPG